jgi:hypothetical protein
MDKWQLKTPVVLIIFNRPNTTEKVFEVIRQAKPPLLLVIADAPRVDRPDDEEKCAATRAIIDRVDWECKVLKNYADINLGCGKRPASGLDWVFELVEEAIILEDDCVPHPTFFRFCEELLERYRHDRRIMSISGQNVQFGRKRTDYSYYFSRYSHGWGWATWRRAWQYFDFDMKLWPEVREGNFLQDILEDPDALSNWTRVFLDTYEGRVNCWDFQFTFACWMQNALSIISNANLVSNIGHGVDASNTTDTSSPFNNIPAEAISFPLKHPPFMVRDREADNFTENVLFDYHPRLLKRVKKKIKRMLKIKEFKY